MYIIFLLYHYTWGLTKPEFSCYLLKRITLETWCGRVNDEDQPKDNFNLETSKLYIAFVNLKYYQKMYVIWTIVSID